MIFGKDLFGEDLIGVAKHELENVDIFLLVRIVIFIGKSYNVIERNPMLFG
jgi:hypothetical protein